MTPTEQIMSDGIALGRSGDLALYEIATTRDGLATVEWHVIHMAWTCSRNEGKCDLTHPHPQGIALGRPEWGDTLDHMLGGVYGRAEETERKLAAQRSVTWNAPAQKGQEQ